jgi:DNA-binding response OmpR family regulator
MNVEPNATPAPAPAPRRALVAEDDPRMRRLVADLVRREGFDVEEIADGEQLLLRVAEALLPRHASACFHLVVSDVRMPFCSGFDVLKKLRVAKRTTPVVLMTAFGEAALRAQVERLDGLLLDKPFTPAELRAAIRDRVAHADP